MFAIAITFLGRSLQRARETKEQEEKEARAQAKDTIDKLKSILENPSTNDLIASLQQQLTEAERADKRRRRNSWVLRFVRGPHLLGVRHGVLFPGTLFVLAASLSALAKGGVADSRIDPWQWWLISLLALVVGVWRLLITLREVERVSASSEDASFRNQVETFKRALAEREDETRTICAVAWQETLPLSPNPPKDGV